MLIKQTIGNRGLWQREKTLFLSSKLAPMATWGKIFEWVDGLTPTDTVVCFNSSEFENETLKTLLVNKIPTVLVVMNHFRDKYNVQVEYALKENRLLIIELQRDEPRGRGSTPRLRNQYVMSQVQHIACGYINKNGSIFGLLAGRDDVTYLLQDEKLPMAAEPTEKPIRWTVAEDKQLLRMFYEDMGIHAIHRAIDRPYSTIYLRIKSLTMNNEVLKGREFEDHVLELLGVANNDKLTLKEWRGDKSLPGVYPEGNSHPDFVFDYDGRPFAIECKWRSHMPKDIEKELLPSSRMATFSQYSNKNKIPVYLLLGIGGLPSDPEQLFFVSLMEPVTAEIIARCSMASSADILAQLSKENQNTVQSNVNKPWSKADDILLEELQKGGCTIEELMKTFGRNRGGIRSRLRKLGLSA